MMPAIPGSIFITKQMKKYVEGKRIVSITCLDFFEGTKNQSGFNISRDMLNNIEKLEGRLITRADSNFIVTENGWLCEFGYGPDCLRYFETDNDYPANRPSSNKTGFFKLKFLFDDNSCLYFVFGGWCSRFDVRPVDPPVNNYPFRSKFPLDVTDKNDFTYDNFKAWLLDKGKWNIIETVVLARGATDIIVSHMNYILWKCNIHPKTKTALLSDDELTRLYDTINEYIDSYMTEKVVCGYTDILGIAHEGNDGQYSFGSSVLATPCPACSKSFEFVNVGGTKAYLCPECQKIRK